MSQDAKPWKGPTTVAGVRAGRAVLLLVFTAVSIAFTTVAIHYASQTSPTAEREAAAVFTAILIGGLSAGGIWVWRTRNEYRPPKSQRSKGAMYGLIFLGIGLMNNPGTQTITAAVFASVMIVVTSLCALTCALVPCEEHLRRKRELGLIE